MPTVPIEEVVKFSRAPTEQLRQAIQSSALTCEGQPIWPIGLEVWQGDYIGREFAEPTTAAEVVGSIMSAAYENLYGHPLLPGSVMGDFVVDAQIYSLSRSLKDAEDAAEAFEIPKRHHVSSFRLQALALLEDAHDRGVSVSKITTELRTQEIELLGLATRVSNQSSFRHNGKFAEAVWSAAIGQLLPPDPDLNP